MRTFAALFSVATLACVACGPGTRDSATAQDNVELFASTTLSAGTVAKACAELDKVCKSQGIGCAAYAQFCSPPPSGPVTIPAAGVICGKVADFCKQGFQKACDVHKTYCGASTPPATPPTPPSNPPAPPSNPPAPPSNPPAPPSNPPTSPAACCSAISSCLSSGNCGQAIAACGGYLSTNASIVSSVASKVHGAVCGSALPASSACCTQLDACAKGSGDCVKAATTCLALTGNTLPPQLGAIVGNFCPSPPPPTPPTPPTSPAACCSAAKTCLNGGDCSKLTSACGSFLSANPSLLSPVARQVHSLVCGTVLAKTSACCTQLDSCATSGTNCIQAATTCMQASGGTLPPQLGAAINNYCP